MKRKNLYLFIFGILLIIAGFIYRATYAGIPYQDPTPELQNSYDQNITISSFMLNLGFIILFISMMIAIVRSLKKSMKQ